MGNWYEVERFRDHVREPDVDDLVYIAQDMGLGDVRVVGRKVLNRVLRFRPSLCSDLYLIGRKPLA